MIVITLEDWALIRRLFVSEKLPKAQIARKLGISRNTVAKAIASTQPPAYSRPPASTSFGPFEQQIQQLFDATPSMPATVLAERVRSTGSATSFRQNVAALRPDYAPTDPADPVVYHPGEQVQCDLWFPEPKIPVSDGRLVMLPVLVIVCCFSKFITAVMIPTRTTADLLAGMSSLSCTQLCAVLRRLIFYNESGIGRRNQLSADLRAFAWALSTSIHQLKPYDPESKSRVERINGYFETSFLPGRDFDSPADFNTQLTTWLPIANGHQIRTLRARPVDLLGADTAAMLALPPLAPSVCFSSGSSFRGTTTCGPSARLLGRPRSDRSDGRGALLSPRGLCPPRRQSRGPAPTLMGQRLDHHRPRPRPDRRPAA